MDKESIEEFRKIYKEKFGEDLTESESLEKARKFLELFKIIYFQERRSSTGHKAKNGLNFHGE